MLLFTPPGFKNPVYNLGSNDSRIIDFSRPDERVQQMTKNLFEKVLENNIEP